MHHSRWTVAAAIAAVLALTASADARTGDGPQWSLMDGVIVTTPNCDPVVRRAAELLHDEVYRRTAIRLRVVDELPLDRAAVLLGFRGAMPRGSAQIPANWAPPEAADGYSVYATGTAERPLVHLTGHDARGALFAAGRLLRELVMRPGEVSVAASTRIRTAPDVAIRGHQYGYRNTANSYDAWDLATYEQEIRDQIVFGANAIELIPTLDPEGYESPHMAVSAWEMTPKLTSLVASYGLDVWLWVPIEGDVSTPSGADEELALQRRLWESVTHVDDVMVPGGDPGHTAPEHLMPFLERMAEGLRAVFPDAGLWVSNQGFEHEQNDWLFNYLQTEQPDWLTGMVYGPWAKLSIQELRERTPAKYPIRRYPDITHTIRCQYPVPDWDPAFAHTLGREPYKPRPLGMAHIYRTLRPYSDGFVTYSDGVNDDVNKVLWSALGWEPDQDVRDILTQYGRYFFGEDLAEAAAEGLLMFERNWDGPAAGNPQVTKTFEHWLNLADREQGWMNMGNWRFQMAFMRALYDAYVLKRLHLENGALEAAYSVLRGAEPGNARLAAAEALAIINAQLGQPVDPGLRSRIEGLGEALWRSIGMQYTVERHFARNSERGAVLDTIDRDITDLRWLKGELEKALAMSSADEQAAHIELLVNWENPGPGGFYDDLGNVAKQPHLVRQRPWEEDPGYVHSSQSGYMSPPPGWRISWTNQGETLYGTPLNVRYTELAPGAPYTLRVMYTGRYRATMSLVANGAHQVHDAMPQPDTPWPIEFSIPAGVIADDGTLELEWSLHSGRGCQVAELWLIPAQD